MKGTRPTPLDWPETNIALFAFLLHLPWELFQLPLFLMDSALTVYETVLHCTRAAAGDVLIALASFWAAVLLVRDRLWVLRPPRRALAAYLASGLAITIVFELLATGPLARWAYSDLMPVGPLLGIGLSPVLQWILLPLLLLWIVRRQLHAAYGETARN